MKKLLVILFLTLTIIGCNNKGSNNETNLNYGNLIIENKDLILNSKLFESYFSTQTVIKRNKLDYKSEENSTDLVSQTQLDNLLAISKIPEEYKKSLNLKQVNDIANKVLDSQMNGSLISAIDKTSLSSETKRIIGEMLKNNVDKLENITAFKQLPQNEKETLTVIYDLTKVYFASKSMQQASFFPNFRGLFAQNCTGSGPNGSGPIDCGVAGAILGISIGGSCCGIGGAIVGGLVGWIAGEIADK